MPNYTPEQLDAVVADLVARVEKLEGKKETKKSK